MMILMMEYINLYIRNRESVVLEEFLEGTEFSYQSVTNGTSIIHSQPIMDFKRVGEGNTGANTGSMGCVCYRNGLLLASIQQIYLMLDL